MREMKQHRIIGFVLLILMGLGLAQCKKKSLPDPVDGTPVFSFAGNVAGQPVSMRAGIDSQYLFTGYQQSVSGLYSFYGNMDRLDCAGCGPALRMEFFDDHTRATGAAIPASDVLQTGVYSFVESVPSSSASGKKVQFFVDSTSIRGPTTFHWTFMMYGSLVGTSTDPNPVQTFSQTGIAQVCLTISDSLGCQSTLCNEVVIQDPPPTCNAFFNYHFLGQSTFQFSAGYSSPVVQQFWDFGDSNFTYTTNPTHSYPAFYILPIKVCLTITDGNCSSTHCMLVDNPNAATCQANFTYAPVADTLFQQMGRVQLVWTDDQGNQYSSFRLGGQPNSSNFKIDQVKEYGANEHGEATRYFEYEVDAWLYNITHPNDSIPIIGTGAFAVAYPK